jgi:monoamine oxidase
VRRISWHPGTVDVTAIGSSGESATLRARAAIVTLPVGVLRHNGDETAVTFEPNLPAQKGEAIANIVMGQVVKVVMWFRSAFWEHVARERYRNAAFFHAEGAAFPAYWTQLPVRSEVVVAWAGGPSAMAMRGLPRAARIEAARDGFGTLFDDVELARKELEHAVTHDWGGDPFARGAYSYVAVDGGDARATLAAPVDGTLFFAGEATSTDGQGGTVNGALETGERAAEEVSERA